MIKLLTGIVIIVPLIIYLYVINILNHGYDEDYDDNLSGFDKARKILNQNKCKDFIIIETKRLYNDTYDIEREILKLSSRNYHENGLTSIGMSSFISYQIIYDKNNNLSKYKNAIDSIIQYVLNFFYILLILGLLINNIKLINTTIYLLFILLIYLAISTIYKINIYKFIMEKESNKFDALKRIYIAMVLFDFTKFISTIIDDVKFIVEKIKNAEN